MSGKNINLNDKKIRKSTFYKNKKINKIEDIAKMLKSRAEFGRVLCLSEVRECWLLIYSSNLSQSAYNFYTYT